MAAPTAAKKSARGSAALMAAGIDSSGNVTVPSVGSYTDIVVKVDGKWLFEKRIMAADLGVFGRQPD